VIACLYYADKLRPPASDNPTDSPASSVVDRSADPAQADRHSQWPRHSDDDDSDDEQQSSSAELPPDIRIGSQGVESELEDTSESPEQAQTPSTPTIDHVIDLDLENRRQRYLLSETARQKFQVLSLRGCEVPYVIRPVNGALDDDTNLRILLNGVREVLIDISVDTKSQGARSIIVECHVISDEGKDIPFTLSNLQSITRRVLRQCEQAESYANDLVAEKAQLEAFLNSRGPKPLADVGAARRRIGELEPMIAEQSEAIRILSADLDVAETLLALATHLHDDCALEISVMEGRRGR
jgi:hypothetical protein